MSQNKLRPDTLLWHYTNDQGMNGITESGQIRPSTDQVNDCALGVGVYFTTKPPYKSNESLLSNNYGYFSKDNTDKVDYGFGIMVQNLPEKLQSQIIKAPDRNVFCVKTNDPIDVADNAFLWDRNDPDMLD